MKTNEWSRITLQLDELRNRLIRHIESAEEGLREDIVKPGDMTSMPTHSADADVEGLDSLVAISLNQESLLEQVEAAIERLRFGTYGLCQQCGCEIGRERLNAVPYAANYIDCARGEHDQPERPVVGEPRHRW